MITTPLLDLLSHTALKGAAVLLAALLLGLALRRAAAARRYALWITAIATLAVLPLAMWVLPAWHVLPKASAELEWPVIEPELVSESTEPVPQLQNNRVTLPASTTALQVPVKVATRQPFAWSISWQDVVAALPMAWVLIASLLLLRLGWSAWRLRRLEATLSSGECEMLVQTARELGLKRMPRLLIGPPDAVPMVWGVLKSRLLLPQGFETWSRDKQRGVLLHELAHLKRGDPLALWTAQWVKALHWFNPLVWLTFRALRADQERACDDAVLRHGVRASDYAQSLLDLSRHYRLAPGLSLCALTITRCAPVEARVKAILDPKRRRDGLTLRWFAGLAGGALLVTLPVAMLHAIEGSALRGRILDRNGVVLAESTKEKVRVYPLKTLASHVVGYVRSTENKVPQPESRKGIEKQQDRALREGKDISLTLDARIQAITGRAMTDAGHTRGAVVVLDPRSGAILAMVSLPSYDPNRFAPAFNQLEWTVYDRGRDGPLIDRCVNHLSSPSGAYVPLTALAAIATGAGDQTFDCKPATTSYAAKFECLKIRGGGAGHGKIGMEAGLQHSCRHYWCQLGMVVGLGEFGKIGQKIGFGQTYGVLELESPGTLPTQAWWEGRRRGNAAWSEVDTASLAEGFGYARVNPLQMAVLAATVANAGRVPQPTLIHGAAPAWRADLVGEGLAEAQMQRLREGMRLAVNSDDGAGHAARSGTAVIAGSLGVIKVVDPDAVNGPPRTHDEWFIGFAPYEAPKLAFAILTQEGNNERAGAAAVAKRLVEETLALPEDGSGQVPPVEDTLDRTAERLKMVQFGVHRDEIAGAVSKAQKESGEGLEIKSRTIEDAHVILRGEASSMSQALQFKDKLTELGKEWHLEWTFPVPRTLKDGTRVEFRAEGVCQTAVDKDARQESTKPKGKTTSTTDGDILLDPQLASQWKLLQRMGYLADLPAKAVITPSKPGTVTYGSVPFQFTAAREDAQRWLANSLGDAMRQHYDKWQPWPEKPGVFDYTYEGFGDCRIHIKTLDAETVEVRLWLQRKGPKPFLIAPDEAAPPPPKTAAPKELSGVVSNDTQRTDEAGQVPFDFDAAEVSREIKLLAKKTGITMAEVKNGGGKLSIIGFSDDLDDARKFGDLLAQSGRQWGIAWHVTTPEKVTDRPVMMFVAVGYYKTTLISAAISFPPSASVSAGGGVVASLSNWRTLQKFGKLADLPSNYVPERIMPAESLAAPMPSVMYAFTASRGMVREWLFASLPSKQLEAQAYKLSELAGTEPFQHEFWSQDLCCVRIECAGDKARVLISRMSTLFKIAPDESQQPRPAGKLAPDYKKDGLTAAEPAVPKLDATLQTLLSTISADEEKRLQKLVPPLGQLKVRSSARSFASKVGVRPLSLDRLQGELSAESERAVLRSSGVTGSRARQTLLSRLPLTR